MPTMTASGSGCLVFETDLGWFGAVAADGVLRGVAIGFPTEDKAWENLQRKELGQREAGPADADLLHRLQRDLTDYAAGRSVDFSGYPVSTEHLTPFQRRVVDVVRAIPYGETRSYADVARAAGSAGAARAVGNVMAGNRVPLVIPCHRVLASGGGLGGFSAPGGTAFKEQLLEMECCRAAT